MAVLVLIRVAASPASLERVYGQGLYPVVQGLLRVVFGAWPVSPALLGLAFALGYLMMAAVWALSEVRGSGWASALGGLARRGLRLVMLLAGLFLVCWGYNYGRPDVPARLGLPGDGPRELLSTGALVGEYARTATRVNELRRGGLSDTAASRAISPAEAAAIGGELLTVLTEIDAPTVPLRRLRVLPKGLLLRFGTAGVYSPWTGDPHIDGALHPLQQRFTACHELAHQQGVTDEGDCNLLAYLTLARSPEPLLAYSAELTYLRYLRAALSRRDPVIFGGLSPKLDTAVVGDLRAIRRAQDAYAEIAPAARDLIYDSYLRTQGVRDGLSSYGRIIDYVVAVRRARPGLLGGSPRGCRSPGR